MFSEHTMHKMCEFGSTEIAKSDQGYVRSHTAFGSDRYDNNQHCTYIISLPNTCVSKEQVKAVSE